MSKELFKSVNELKEFIVWAKSEKIQALTVGEVSIQFSAIAMIDDEFDQPEAKESSKVWTDGSDLNKSDLEDEEDLMYWSSSPVKG